MLSDPCAHSSAPSTVLKPVVQQSQFRLRLRGGWPSGLLLGSGTKTRKALYRAGSVLPREGANGGVSQKCALGREIGPAYCKTRRGRSDRHVGCLRTSTCWLPATKRRRRARQGTGRPIRVLQIKPKTPTFDALISRHDYNHHHDDDLPTFGRVKPPLNLHAGAVTGFDRHGLTAHCWRQCQAMGSRTQRGG